MEICIIQRAHQLVFDKKAKFLPHLSKIKTSIILNPISMQVIAAQIYVTPIIEIGDLQVCQLIHDLKDYLSLVHLYKHTSGF